MSSFEQLKAQALELGLSGADVAQYVVQQQNGEREERAREREERLAKLQAEKEVQLAQIAASKEPASQIVEVSEDEETLPRRLVEMMDEEDLVSCPTASPSPDSVSSNEMRVDPSLEWVKRASLEELVDKGDTMAVDGPPSFSRYTDGGPVGVGCVVQTGDVSSDSAYDSVDRILQKFEMALQEKSIAPVRRELQLRLLKLSSLELKDNESLSTLESNFSDDNDQLSYEEEDVLEFTEIFDMFQQQAPEGIKANFTKIIESKKIPIRRSRDTQNKKTFFVYAENKIMMKICDNLSPHDVFQMYGILRESKAVERDSFIKNILSQPVDPNALDVVPGLKDVAFYYLILTLMRNHILNRLYTHKLVFLFDQLKQMKVAKEEATQDIERALASLDRYPIASRPPGLCIIFIMVRDREGAQKDLQRVRELFEKIYAFDVFVKKDPTSEDIKNIIIKLRAARNKFYDRWVYRIEGVEEACPSCKAALPFGSGVRVAPSSRKGTRTRSSYLSQWYLEPLTVRWSRRGSARIPHSTMRGERRSIEHDLHLLHDNRRIPRLTTAARQSHDICEMGTRYY
ncbi:hypothetical protein Pcinc_026431 [Petrolisthes cinctipes]|uniref:Peptidase C14 caspase domain-containing protein n=1 Tax=Petrolisthes cinctipes TaxID=88211 RepID=A0AAE1F6P7_PETCI|nr:hypothetical protein Pcinc_026431 [Petrolisthes cinctipes]